MEGITDEKAKFPYSVFMSIYFTASIVGRRYHQQQYEKIVALLQKQGHRVIANHILKTTESAVREETETDRRKYHQQLKQWINEVEAVVAECSYPSTGVGFEISYALSRNKPVLMLYKQGNTPPSLFENYSDEFLICEQYTDTTLTHILSQFLVYIRGGSQTRYTFSLTPRIAVFLEKVTRKKNVPKSVFIRQLIEREMEKSL